jgi:hypothetical protein
MHGDLHLRLTIDDWRSTAAAPRLELGATPPSQ